ncbi:hypothetical protein CAI21_12815 [Alkalilimnicola ehrlichii]|uniref:hypothetical protein n=1 Tax=Alkalilimnicola ehrlichii TaxID=351052 RepID=UPI000E2F8254|nr:hypothetical protein [Alkalilimnicola ehrlichii]RFA28210.1 hypothetical protein CAI21_12815 [Alkalilimnicola ehrlichii]
MGCATEDGAGTRPVLQWFRDHVELSAYLWRMEPQRWGIKLNELTDLKESSRPIYTQLDVFGPNEELRQALNALTLPAYGILWWGSFTDLCAGNSDWSRHWVSAFTNNDTVDEEQQEAFVAFLRDHLLANASAT